MSKRKTKSRIALGIAAAMLAACAAACCVLLSMSERASNTRPDPFSEQPEAVGTEQEDPFPNVDWGYWLSVNEDVVGWVTVPGTDIDQPIVRADPADPQHYLWHDVYRERNCFGCPYLDATCDPGFGGPNSVVFGHNMGGRDQTMFGDFELFSDAAYAEGHATVLLQTPTSKTVLEVRCVDVIPGWDPSNCTSFGSRAEFLHWYGERLADAAVVLDASAEPESVVTFCTCSYGLWSNERTLVIAAPSTDASK